MIWEYKTVLFEFSKDGLLSDRYVDDEEMENNLNQLGQQGWDLVNVSLLQDGLLASLKRPAENAPLLEELSPKEQNTVEVQRPLAASPATPRQVPSQPPLHAPFRSGRSPRSPISVEHLRERVRQQEEPEPEQRPQQQESPAPSSDRIGGIRIS